MDIETGLLAGCCLLEEENQKAKMHILLILFLIIPSGIILAQEIPFGPDHIGKQPISRPQHGVIFLPGKLISNADINHLFMGFHVQIPTIQHSLTAAQHLPFCNRTLLYYNKKARLAFQDVCNQTSELIKVLHNIVTRLFDLQKDQITEILSSIPDSAYLWQHNDDNYGNKRHKRGLVNFIGQASYVLFGTSRDSDTRKNRKLINQAREQLKITGDEMLELSNSTAVNFDTIVSQITKIHGNIDNMRRRLATLGAALSTITTEAHMQKAIQSVISATLSHHLTLISYMQNMIVETSKFTNGVDELLKGHLSEALVPPSAITRALQGLSGRLRRKYPRFQISFFAPGYYYETSEPRFLMGRDQMLIYLPVPIATDTHLFRVYQTETFFLPIHYKNSTQTDATILVDLPEQVAISLDNRFYFPIEQNRLQACVGHRMLQCPHFSFVQSLTAHTCIAALILNSREEISKLCKPKYVVSPNYQEYATHINDSTLLVISNSKRAEIICDNDPPKSIAIHHHALITLPCNCALKTEYFWSSYSLRNCERQSDTLSVTFPFNDDFLKAFNITQDLQLPAAETPWLIDDPLPMATRQELLDQGDETPRLIDLHKLARSIKDNSAKMDIHTTHSWLYAAADWGQRVWHTGIVIILTLLMIALAVFIWLKYKKAIVAIAVAASSAQPAGGVAGRPILPTQGPNPMESYKVVDTTNNTHVEMGDPNVVDIMILALMVSVVILLLAVLITRCIGRAKAQRKDGIYLQVVAGMNSYMLYLSPLAVQGDCSFIERKPIVASWKPAIMLGSASLRVVWGRKLIVTTPFSHEYHRLDFPPVVEAPIQLARVIAENDSPIRVRVVRVTGGMALPVTRNIAPPVMMGWSVVGSPADRLQIRGSLPPPPGSPQSADSNESIELQDL